MQSSNEHQELANFFADRPLPSGPQHINEYSIFLDLTGAINSQLKQLQSGVEASRKSAALMLGEVKEWLLNQDVLH